jgi:AraC-like DNA-binding protein
MRTCTRSCLALALLPVADWADMGDSSGHGRVAKVDSSVAIPTEYLAHLVEICARFQVRPEPLLKGTGLKPSVLERPPPFVPKAAFLTVVERALALTGEPGLGFYHGLSLKLSSHGTLGLLAMTSGTLGDVLLVLERYVQLRATELSLHTRPEAGSMVIEFHNQAPAALRVFFAETVFAMLLHVGRTLVGHPIAARCEVAFPEPAHFRRFAHLLPADVRFDQPAHRIVVPESLLAEAVLTSDSVTARRVERDCQRELSELRERASFLTTLCRHLRPEHGDFPSLEELAERTHSSTRTLKRKLAQQGTTYRKLVDELRRERATELLDTSNLSLPKIASMLGYTDTASFHRSFRRWFKSTPSRYRDQS